MKRNSLLIALVVALIVGYVYLNTSIRIERMSSANRHPKCPKEHEWDVKQGICLPVKS